MESHEGWFGILLVYERFLLVSWLVGFGTVVVPSKLRALTLWLILFLKAEAGGDWLVGGSVCSLFSAVIAACC